MGWPVLTVVAYQGHHQSGFEVLQVCAISSCSHIWGSWQQQTKGVNPFSSLKLAEVCKGVCFDVEWVQFSWPSKEAVGSPHGGS